jgi:transmembrane sensor
MQETRLVYLFNRYFDKTACEAEHDEFLALVAQEDAEGEIHKLMETAYQKFEPAHQPFPLGSREKMMVAILKELPREELLTIVKRRVLWPRFATAAAILLIIGAGFWFYPTFVGSDSKNKLAQNDIAPGKHTAILTLADGKTINLSDAKTGLVIDEAALAYNDGSKVQNSSKTSGDPSLYSEAVTMSTPAGGTYEIKLSDGTRVWLNASSSLKFPRSFASLKERKVELTGEGYFEVAKNKALPFIVVSKEQKVEVLGTHFNISSYKDEPVVKTTLLEGSVQVVEGQDEILLKPGQQSIIGNGKPRVIEVQTEDMVAWKNGYFMFNNESLEDIMRKVARWYNVDVEYRNVSTRKITFFGTVSRFSNISQVLFYLEKTGEVKFEIEGKRVIVIKK